MKKQTFAKLARKTVAAIAAGALALSMFGCAGRQAEQQTVGDDSVAMADGETTSTTATTSSNKGTYLNIKAGAATLVEGTADTYYFPNLVVETNDPRPIKSITIQFTSAVDNKGGDKIKLVSTDSKFTPYSGNKAVNASMNAAGGATAAEWEKFLQNPANMTITLKGADTKSLRMIANFEQVSRTVDFNSTNGHYYETCLTTSTWADAFAAANSKSYMGLKGYLVTITDQYEHDFVYKMIGQNCWMGLTCWDNYTKDVKNKYKDYYKSAHSLDVPSVTYNNNGAQGNGPCYYYWVCGPEAGKLVTYGNYKGSRTAVKDPATGVNMYSNWASGEPNNSGSNEFCAHFFVSQNGQWNDYPNTTKCYYVIEYGGLEADTDTENEVDLSTASASEAYVKIDIDIDPAGRTITTESYNVKVGESLKISENVNGGSVQTKKPGVEEFEPAKIERTFEIKDPTTGQWRALADTEANADGEPIHAGTYRVTSKAIYGYEEDGTTPVYFKAGTSKFRIDPKEIDLTQAKAPLVTKVYDGTDTVAAPTLDISEFLAPGCTSVSLATDPTATYDSVSVGSATKVTVTGAALTGANAGDYTLKIKDAEKKSMEVKAAITPRDLVVTASSNVSWGLEHEALKTSEGKDPAYRTDLAVHDASATAWPANELASRDAINGDVAQTILGTLTFTEKAGDVTLNAANPERGLYKVRPHYSNVPDDAKATTAIDAADESDDSKKVDGEEKGGELESIGTMSLMAADDPEEGADADKGGTPAPAAPALDTLTVKKIDENTFDIGNYILTYKTANILVTADPYSENQFEEADSGFTSKSIDKKVDPEAKPLSDDEIKNILKEAGVTVPEGANIVITKDGKPVDKIDPSEVGSYAIVATYPDENGDDTVVRVDYNVLTNDPIVVKESVTVKRTDGTEPVTKDELAKLVGEMLDGWLPEGVEPTVTITDASGKQVSDIDLAKEGAYTVKLRYVDEKGVLREVELTYNVKEGAVHQVDEDIVISHDPEGTPITGDDIAKRIKDSYPKLVPDGVEPTVTIIGPDGTEVPAVDPAVPGDYEVTLTYTDPETGETKTVKVHYKVDDIGLGANKDGIDRQAGATDPSTDDGNGDGAGDGNGDGADRLAGSADPSTGANGSDFNSGDSGYKGWDNANGQKGFADRLLAQTGDPVFWVICGVVVVAVVAGVVLVVARKKNNKQQ